MEEVRMYFIGLDDGANVGPFLTEEDALKHFAHALSIYSTDDLQPTAIGLHVLHDSLNEDGRVQWIEIARALVKHADCFIWKMEYVSGLTTMINGVSPREIALNILGEGSERLNIIEPAVHLDAHRVLVVDTATTSGS